MKKRELTFLAAGVLMLLIVILYSALAIGFLVGKFNSAFNKKTDSQSNGLRFQLEKAETLRIR